MSIILKETLGILSLLFKTKPTNFEYQSEQLQQLKNSLDPANNMRVYYNNVANCFNKSVDSVKATNGIK